jgi:spore maturation protein SpmA
MEEFYIVSSLALTSIVFACVFGSSVVAMTLRRFLPDHHLSADSKDAVKLGMGLIATLTALVLGMLIATANGTYDAQSAVINEMSANYHLFSVTSSYQEITRSSSAIKISIRFTRSRLLTRHRRAAIG